MDGRHASGDGTEKADETESSETTETPADTESGLDSALRRQLLASTASVGALATAGCLGILGDGSETGPRPGGPTAVEETTDDTTPNGTATPGGPDSFSIEYVVQEATLDVPTDETLLDAGLDADLDMPYQCQVGVCGQCASTVDGDGTELVEHGDVGYGEMGEAEFQAGYVLPCVAEPRDELSLTTGKQDELDSFMAGETTPTPEETSTPGGVESYAINYVEQGDTIDVASDETLLKAGEDEGWELPKQCEVGVCGQCTSKVDGDGSELVEHDGNQYLSDEQLEEGYVLTCVGYPRDDFELTTGVKDEADQI
ncbi:2Fe-2S iron-sulfur cluster-binding protein [Halapricum desulfuricans]|uniref:Ferredoxin n=1 Tax=Halapricum desulfuricans TaxID=2841257 RepID=A0A897N3J1_9EURY|nr:2Fe-2S iron-sulfur cluster-binding protein [Halapricum desulfuricans]QSG07552.1 Ferredoxin [Halapricum desulfuricans]